MLYCASAQGSIFQFYEHAPQPDIYLAEAPGRAFAAPDHAVQKITVEVDKRFGMAVRFDPDTPMANLALGIDRMANEMADIIRAEVKRIAAKAVSDYLTGARFP